MINAENADWQFLHKWNWAVGTKKRPLSLRSTNTAMEIPPYQLIDGSHDFQAFYMFLPYQVVQDFATIHSKETDPHWQSHDRAVYSSLAKTWSLEWPDAWPLIGPTKNQTPGWWLNPTPLNKFESVGTWDSEIPNAFRKPFTNSCFIITCWGYIYPSENYESQLGWLFPIYGDETCSKPPTRYGNP